MGLTMLLGVLRMPPELWRDDPIDVAQRHSRYLEAADEIERLHVAYAKSMERIRKGQDRDTRHCCAEAVIEAIENQSWCAEKDDFANVAHDACMNARCVKGLAG